ncbi:Regulatory factor X, 7 [Cichlidogyrus casuarinus]|uniref:Regulatory factor X, 7 n=1 Tax=Cichlidogyrus casuarinus TaxID=1844966 RepID=A0ABD2QPP0_9PLAT
MPRITLFNFSPNRQQQQSPSEDSSMLSRLSSYSALQQNLSSSYTPPSAHKSFESGSSCNVSGLLRSTDTAGSFIFGSSNSSYNGGSGGSQLPPAPLQPIAGAKPPYTPTYQLGNTSTSSAESISSKRTLPTPMDAPGSYDPSPQVHLGSVSPSKRPRFSSGIGASEARNEDPYGYYPGRYDNLGMLSPLPTSDQTGVRTIQSGGYQMNAGTEEKPEKKSGSIFTPQEFSLALEDDSVYGMVDLPRLGASPGPQSPTQAGEGSNWANFYGNQAKDVDSEEEDSFNRTLTATTQGEEDELAQRSRMRGEVNTPPAPKELMMLEPTSPTAPAKDFRDDEQLHTPGPVEEDASSQCSSPSGPDAPTLASSGAASTSSTHNSEGPLVQNSPVSTSSSPIHNCKSQILINGSALRHQ